MAVFSFFVPIPAGLGQEILTRSVIPALLVWAIGLLIHLPAWHKRRQREQTLPVITGWRWYTRPTAEPAERGAPQRAQEPLVIQRDAA